jgi:hypothetical protein
VLVTGGNIAVLRADTAQLRYAAGGVPYAFTDTLVANGRTYYYAVTAFDVNSWQSGPSSLESSRTLKAVRPRVASRQESGGGFTIALIGGDGTMLDTTGVPSLDSATGIFTGPMPAANGLELLVPAFVPQLADSGVATVSIDSVVPGSTLSNPQPTAYHLTRQVPGLPPERMTIALQGDPNGAARVERADARFRAAAYGRERAARFGGDSTLGFEARLTVSVPGAWALSMKGRAHLFGVPSGPNNGMRWWSGSGNENVTDPNGRTCPVVAGFSSCVLTDLSRNAGQIPGVEIFGIQSYLTTGSATPLRDLEGVTSTVFRAADMKVYWGAAGRVDSVVDVTHRVPVPFSPLIRASWGILNVASFAATAAASTADQNNALLTWSDVICVGPAPALTGACGGAAQTPASLMNRAQLNPVWFASSGYSGTAGQVSNGTGFVFYLSGTFTMFRLLGLPAAGTVWNARFYAGNIAGTVGRYEFQPALRPPAVPGLAVQIRFTGTRFDPATTRAEDLARVHTVPDPYYGTHELETATGRQLLRFVNVPARSIIRIYSTSGILVTILTNNDVTGGGEVEWDVRNRTGTRVGSGVYFWHLETPDRRQRIGRMTLINTR